MVVYSSAPEKMSVLMLVSYMLCLPYHKCKNFPCGLIFVGERSHENETHENL